MKRLASQQLLKYENKWVALNKETKQVIAASKTLTSLNRKLPRANKKSVILFKVLPFDISLSPHVH